MDALEADELLLPVNLASRLVLSNTAFAQQFIAAGGWAGEGEGEGAGAAKGGGAAGLWGALAGGVSRVRACVHARVRVSAHSAHKTFGGDTLMGYGLVSPATQTHLLLLLPPTRAPHPPSPIRIC